MHIPTRIYSIKIKLILSCSFHQRQNILLCLRFYLFSFSTLWFSTEQSSLFSCSQSYGHRRHNPQVAGPGLGSSPPTRSAILSGHLLTSSPQSPLALKVPVVCENRGKKHPAKHSARSTLLSFPELTSGTHFQFSLTSACSWRCSYLVSCSSCLLPWLSHHDTFLPPASSVKLPRAAPWNVTMLREGAPSQVAESPGEREPWRSNSRPSQSPR